MNLTGQPTDTTLNSVTASLNAIPSVKATIKGGSLSIASTDPNVTITFSQDSSHALAALGINTFFSGYNAGNLAVNSTTAANPNLLAAAQNGVPGDNSNALGHREIPQHGPIRSRQSILDRFVQLDDQRRRHHKRRRHE